MVTAACDITSHVAPREQKHTYARFTSGQEIARENRLFWISKPFRGNQKMWCWSTW